MTKALKIVDHDAHFKALPFEPIILNDIPAHTLQERSVLNDLMTTTYSHADSLEPVPTCAPGCGYLSYGHNLGRLCPKCNTRVEPSTDRVVESTLWFRAPEGISALINPILWMILSKYMTTSKFNVLAWFCNKRHPMPDDKIKQANINVKRLLKTGVPRGYNSFIDNFDQLIEVLSTMATTVQDKMELKRFLLENRKVFFPQHIPMPSKVAFILEETSTGTYADLAMRDAIDAVRTITAVSAMNTVTPQYLEGRMVSIIADLSNYYMDMFVKHFSDKYGWIRHSTLGTRMPFSWRTVISSGGTTEVMDYESIKIPYSQATVMFKVHLENLLCKEGMSEREAGRFIDTHSVNRNERIERLLMYIFKSAKGGRGYPTLLTRYPTLARAATQCLRIIGLTDSTTLFHIMTVRGPNADYDGDVLSGFISLSDEQTDNMEEYRPHYGIFSFTTPRRLNNNPALPDTDISTIAHYLEDEENRLGPMPTA